MTNLSVTSDPANKTTSRRLTGVRGAALAVGVASFALGACGGGSDDEASVTTTTEGLQTAATTTSTTVATAPTTSAPPTTPVSTEVQYVTDGATVVVANASRVDGAAGRLSERLAAVGFETDTPQDSSEGPLEVTKVYYNASADGAQVVADSIRLALGGGAITVNELSTPPPVQSGDIGDGSVLIAMGNDIADRTLQDLQGLTPATSAPASDDSSGDDSSGDDGSGDDGSGDTTTTTTTTG